MKDVNGSLMQKFLKDQIYVGGKIPTTRVVFLLDFHCSGRLASLIYKMWCPYVCVCVSVVEYSGIGVSICICHLGDICTWFGGWAIPVSVQRSFQQFLLKLVQTGLCSSSKYHTFNPKQKVLFPLSRFLVWIFLLPLMW